MTGFLASLEGSAFSTWLVGSGSIWAFPTILTLHTLGMMTLAGAAAIVDLRLLGVAPQIPLETLRKLFPFMWAGFWLNLISGSMLFAAEATAKASTPLFFVKLAFVAVGVVTIRRIDRRVYGQTSLPLVASSSARTLAFVSLASWIAAITAGRLLAYVGQG